MHVSYGVVTKWCFFKMSALKRQGECSQSYIISRGTSDFRVSLRWGRLAFKVHCPRVCLGFNNVLLFCAYFNKRACMADVYPQTYSVCTHCLHCLNTCQLTHYSSFLHAHRDNGCIYTWRCGCSQWALKSCLWCLWCLWCHSSPRNHRVDNMHVHSHTHTHARTHKHTHIQPIDSSHKPISLTPVFVRVPEGRELIEVGLLFEIVHL